MAYETFIPNVEAVNLLKEVERRVVFAKFCSRDYEGTVANKGDQVRIYTIGKPTIYSLNKDATGGKIPPNAKNGTGKEVIQTNIGDAETVEGASITLQINEIRLFHYVIGDIDKEQSSRKNLLQLLRASSAQGIAEEIDKYVVKLMVDEKGSLYSETPTSIISEKTNGTDINVLDFIDDLVVKFADNEIGDNEQLILSVSPKFWKVFKKAYRELDTHNSELLKRRGLGYYNGIIVNRSTLCYKADGTNEFVFIRTGKAVTLVNPLYKVLSYLPDKSFAEAIKGYTLFDGKVVYPKQLISAKVAVGY